MAKTKEELIAVSEIEKTLKCPSCGGLQVEEKNCYKGGYRQWRCVGCGCVEQSGSRHHRAILHRWRALQQAVNKQ